MTPECHTALCHILQADVSPPADEEAWRAVALALPLQVFVDRTDRSFMTEHTAATEWLLDALFDRLVHAPRQPDGPSRHTVLAGVWVRAATWAKYWAHAGHGPALARLARHTTNMSDPARTTIWKDKGLDIVLGAARSGSLQSVETVSAHSTPHACATTLSVLLSADTPTDLEIIRLLAAKVPHLVSELCSLFFASPHISPHTLRWDAWLASVSQNPPPAHDWVGICRNLDCEDHMKVRRLDVLWCSLPQSWRPAPAVAAMNTLFASAHRFARPLWTAEQDHQQLTDCVSASAAESELSARLRKM